MHLVAIGWMYVVLMMCIAEALSSQGSVLGALVTFVLYGVLPLGIVLYILGTPARKRRLRQAGDAQAATAPAANAPPLAPAAASDSQPPDGGGQTAAGGVAPEREEPRR